MESEQKTRTDGAPRNGAAAGHTPAADAAPPEKKRGLPPGARIPLLIVGAVVVIALLVWGVRALAYSTTHQTTDDAKVDADTVTVTSKISERVARLYVDTNQAVKKGQLLVQLDDTDEQTRYQQAQAALQAQRATARAAQENVALTSATVSAQTQQGRGGIDTASNNISSAAQQAAAADQQIAVAQQAADQARAQLGAAQAGVPAAREALAKANADYSRTASLVASGDLARSQLDAAKAAREQAQSQYQEALDNVTAAQANLSSAIQRVAAAQSTASSAHAVIGVQQGQLVTAQGKLAESDSPFRVSAQQAQAAAAQAQVASQLAQLRTASDQLNYTKIYSPIDGYVGEKSVDIGQQVSPGMALMTIVPLTNTYITANFKETQIGNMKAGEPVDISVDAYKGVKFQGHVSAIGPASQNTFALVPAQNASGNFVKVTQRIPVRILVDPTPETQNYVLRPGMSVVASVKVK